MALDPTSALVNTAGDFQCRSVSCRWRGLSPSHLLQSSWDLIALRRPRLAHRANGLRGSHANRGARSRRGSLPNAGRGPDANSDIGIARSLLPLDHNEGVSQGPKRQACSRPGLVVVVEGDGAAAAVRSTNGPVLAEVAVVLGPELVLGAVAVVVAVERLGGVVGWVMSGEGFDDVELDSRVAGEAVESKVRVASRVVFSRVIDNPKQGSAREGFARQRVNSQVLASPIAFSSNKVAARAQNPV